MEVCGVEKQSAFQRVVLPILIVLSVMVVSINVYNYSRAIGNRSLHLFISHISAFFMFLSIWLGALFGNTFSFFRGASFKERLLVCLAPPSIWSAKVLYDFYGIYSLGEFLFLFVHNLIIGCPVVALLCMGLSDIWCRAIYRKRAGNASLKVFALSNTVTLTTGIVLTFMMLWNGGHTYYYFYMDLYTYLFL